LGCWLDSSVQIPDIEIAPFGGRCWCSVFILAHPHFHPAAEATGNLQAQPLANLQRKAEIGTLYKALFPIPENFLTTKAQSMS